MRRPIDPARTRGYQIGLWVGIPTILGAVVYYLFFWVEPHGSESERGRDGIVQQNMVVQKRDIVQEKDFLTANPSYLEHVRSVITSSGFSCPQIVHLWAGNSPIGPKLEAFCDAKDDPDALHYAFYPDDHTAVAWSSAEDFEKHEQPNKAKARAEAEKEQKNYRLRLCQMASMCDEYKQARLDCAAAGNLKSCVLIKMGSHSDYADLCSDGEIGSPALPPSRDTPNAVECFLLKLGLY